MRKYASTCDVMLATTLAIGHGDTIVVRQTGASRGAGSQETPRPERTRHWQTDATRAFAVGRETPQRQAA